MNRYWGRIWPALLAGCIGPFAAYSQIDPVNRELIQLGYNAALEGHPPLAAYAFYYRNQPDFLGTNMALRLAVAPTYLDSELGIRRVLSEHTDLGIGLAGGGFADTYDEIDHGFFPSIRRLWSAERAPEPARISKKTAA